ncbi:SDR family NAD(P)-dependent oxidoreductase [Thalassotalea crassostreae]|uniref:SDR family NAD(P)-dependent oxidoreductase n=1 Tax=Thalassotalea crassostreae TaxID=1763536 RepID=UPI000838DD3D|nr:SDR family oxidoreductase [Thalassotalea crassostreae]
MSSKFEGKFALITGAGSGIGQSTALKLAEQGAHIIIVDLDIEAANATLQTIEELGAEASVYQCNIADNAQVSEVVASILDKHPIDILINNAGIAHVGNLENTTEDDLDRIYNVNVKGAYNMMHSVIGSMKKQQSGVILNLASIAASVGIEDRFAYSMSKGAVLTMTYSVARDYINDGIRCNCISPGRVHTPFVDNFIEKNYPDNQEEVFTKLSKSQPIGRMGKVDEMAALISYLCSDDAAFITGSNFPIDGGFVTLNN